MLPALNTKKVFQIGASSMALSANQIDARWKLTNQRVSSKHRYENPTESSQFECISKLINTLGIEIMSIKIAIV